MMSKDQTCPGSSLLLSLLVSNLKRPVAILAVLAVLALSACSAPASRDAVYDPAQPFNRMSHGINKGVDRVLLRPASQLYAAAVPAPVAAGVNNVASNLSEPSAVVNDVLQGNLEDGVHTTFRFLLNSTVGFAGLFDVAASIGLEKRDSDFGETLHVWGAGEGAYLELPFLGPSTTRDFVGVVVDGAMNPTRLAFTSTEERQAIRRLKGVDLVGDRAQNGGVIDDLLYESADSYIALRGLYLQNRRYALSGGTVGSELDPFYDPFSDPFAAPFSLPNRP